MKKTTLSELKKRNGKLLSPWVDQLGDVLSLTSWSIDRLPEYIWMALILEDLGRVNGISCCIRIFNKMRLWNPEYDTAKMSIFLAINEAEQDALYDIIKSEANPEILAPLTAVIGFDYSPSFYRHFYMPNYDYERRIEKLAVVSKVYYRPDSNEGTDLRFLSLIPQVLSGSLSHPPNTPLSEALYNYGNLEHSEPIMGLYRTSIRATEGAIALSDGSTSAWINHFWDITSKATDCGLHYIVFGKEDSEMDYLEFIENTKEALNYLNIQHKQDTVTDEAYIVLSGSLVFAFKTFAEVIHHDLSNTIIGRQSVRIIIETYIMMKYLVSQEGSKPNIWSEYQAYGIGKYKLILMKLREDKDDGVHHVDERILDLLVNEPQLEEFTDIDLKYFDSAKIREKAFGVGEKALYDVAYDYDSSYAHGLWGAVRESSMLACDNIFHHFRPVTDALLKQKLPDITWDCYNYLRKLILLVNDRYPFPEWYINYIGVANE